MKKERYYFNRDFLLSDRDNDETFINANIVRDRLNQQDARIKELEEENQQLKENLLKFLHRISDQNEEILQLKQSQNQKAIEELEKLKNNIWDLNIGDYYLQNGGLFENIKVKRAEVYELIDNQIKELRGEENE